jgi:hypothetical protein
VKNTMKSKKKLLMLIAVAMSVLMVGAFAYTQLSNILSGSFSVSTNPTSLPLSWVGTSPDIGDPSGGAFVVGATYQLGMELTNPTAATFSNVVVYFTINCASALPTKDNAITLNYWYEGAWTPITLTVSGGTASGTFGPSTGFPVVPGYDATTQLQIIFNGDAPATGYSFSIEAGTAS